MIVIKSEHSNNRSWIVVLERSKKLYDFLMFFVRQIRKGFL